jgi:hypothetical protein
MSFLTTASWLDRRKVAPPAVSFLTTESWLDRRKVDQTRHIPDDCNSSAPNDGDRYGKN